MLILILSFCPDVLHHHPVQAVRLLAKSLYFSTSPNQTRLGTIDATSSQASFQLYHAAPHRQQGESDCPGSRSLGSEGPWRSPIPDLCSQWRESDKLSPWSDSTLPRYSSYTTQDEDQLYYQPLLPHHSTIVSILQHISPFMFQNMNKLLFNRHAYSRLRVLSRSSPYDK